MHNRQEKNERTLTQRTIETYSDIGVFKDFCKNFADWRKMITFARVCACRGEISGPDGIDS